MLSSVILPFPIPPYFFAFFYSGRSAVWLAHLPWAQGVGGSNPLAPTINRNRFVKMKESLRYLQNAKEILSKARIENERYADVKYVREAFGTAYLAILESINEVLIKRGLTKKELPKSIDSYRDALRKHLAIRNGKLTKEFEALYDELHIAGYYRGLLTHTIVVKEILKKTKEFIEKIK